jgi:tRNA G18 (ribose-2'-O)-methylase SpoU
MFRTADGAGVDTVFISGYTQSPAEQGKQWLTDAEKSLAKTALGAEHAVSWKRVSDIHELIDGLKGRGTDIVSLESGKGSVHYRSFSPCRDVALIVGNETDGVATELLDKSDAILGIPMRGAKESLNVSVAAGIALFSLNDTMRG